MSLKRAIVDTSSSSEIPDEPFEEREPPGLDAIADARPIHLASDQPGLLELFEMSGDGRLRVGKFLDQFADYEGWREYLYREGAKRRDAFGFFISEEPPERRDPSG